MDLQKIAQLGRKAATKKAPVPLATPAAVKSTPAFISLRRPDDLSSSSRVFGGRNWRGSLGLNNYRSATNDLGRVGNRFRKELRRASSHTEGFLRNLFTGGNYSRQWARGKALDAARGRQLKRLRDKGMIDN